MGHILWLFWPFVLSTVLTGSPDSAADKPETSLGCSDLPTLGRASGHVGLLCTETDRSSAPVIYVQSVGGPVPVRQGTSAWVPVRLDCNGYFYWYSLGKWERTRPSSRATSWLLVVRECRPGRVITWYCYS